mmetsp:Transcript_60941/g.145225  ORF Transcript_60941/g.145225 Transcript_60941/m.145225 type:complete len:228 (+) Transcript_60941:306-989(+)
MDPGERSREIPSVWHHLSMMRTRSLKSYAILESKPYGSSGAASPPRMSGNHGKGKHIFTQFLRTLPVNLCPVRLNHRLSESSMRRPRSSSLHELHLKLRSTTLVKTRRSLTGMPMAPTMLQIEPVEGAVDAARTASSIWRSSSGQHWRLDGRCNMQRPLPLERHRHSKVGGFALTAEAAYSLHSSFASSVASPSSLRWLCLCPVCLPPWHPDFSDMRVSQWANHHYV